MAKVRLRYIMGCPELKSNYQEKGLLHNKILYPKVEQKFLGLS